MELELKVKFMKNFSIEIISKTPQKIDGQLSYWMRITIGNFVERFLLPIENWSLNQYFKQWEEGIERIKIKNSSCLVTAVQNLNSMHPSIEQWVLYRENQAIFIQQQLLINETVQFSNKLANFSSKTCYDFINPRKTITDEGKEISEWSCCLNDIVSWLGDDNVIANKD